MRSWQIIFFNNVPIWQYGTLIRTMETPLGPVPTLFCTTVTPVLNGFLEATIAEEGHPQLTMLIRADHVLSARSSREPQAFGFGTPLTASNSAAPNLPSGGGTAGGS